MGHQVHAITYTKCRELLDRLRNTIDTPHQSLASPDHPGPPSWTLGQTKLIPYERPHHIGVPKHRCGPDRTPQYQQVIDFLASFGMVDLLGHFSQILWFWYMQTWFQVWQGQIFCPSANISLVQTYGCSIQWAYRIWGTFCPNTLPSTHSWYGGLTDAIYNTLGGDRPSQFASSRWGRNC